MQEIIDKEKYSSSKFAIPYNKNLSKEEKEYYNDWMEAIYSYWVQGKTGITAQDCEKFRYWREFGEGNQSEDLYKNVLMGTPRTDNSPPTTEIETDVDTGENANRETKRRGYMNLLWDILSPADKLMAALIGKLAKLNSEISVDAVDEKSKNEVERRKFDLLRYMDNKDFEDQYRWMAGIPAENPEFMPQNREELDLYAEEEGFKLPFAIAMEEITAVTEKISSWQEIKDQLYTDMINLNVTGMLPYFDEGKKMVMFKYLDPEMAIIQHSKYNDFRDSEYGGNFEFVPISELIQKGVVTDSEKIKELMEKYANKLNNPALSDYRDFSGGQRIDHTQLEDTFKVLVLRCWWVDNDVKKDLIHEKKNGEKRVRDYNPDKKVGKNERVRETTIRKLYTANWVIGTEYCYDFGLFKDILRKNKNDVNFPQFMYRRKGRSLTRQIIPLYNALQLNWLKYQDAVATAKKAGYVIDYNAIVNMKQGGSKNPEKEVIRRLLQTGIIVVKPTNIGGRMNVFQKPVEELMGGLGRQLDEFITSFKFNSDMIEEFTGINPITLGSQPDNDALVGTTEISVAGTDNILQNMVNAIMRIQQKAHDYTVDWLQLLFKYNPLVRKIYQDIIGEEAMAAILAAIKDNVSYGCFITAGISEAEERELLESAKISLQNGRDGKPGITEADYAYILRMLKSKASTKKIHLVLAQRIRRAMDEASQRAEQTATADRQAQAENDKMKFEQEKELETLKHEHKITEIQEQGNQDRKTAVVEAELQPEPEPVGGGQPA